MVDGHLLPVRPSVGLSVAPARSDLQADVLLKQSDLAMYAAKRARGAGVATFASDTGPMRRLVVEDDAPRLGLLGDLRQDQVFGNRRDPHEARLTEEPLDMELSFDWLA